MVEYVGNLLKLVMKWSRLWPNEASENSTRYDDSENAEAQDLCSLSPSHALKWGSETWVSLSFC